MQRRSFLKAGAGVMLAPAFAHAESAADFPSRTVTIVVPFTPGQAGDVVARVVAEALSKLWGKSVVVDNRGGAGGTLGARVVANAVGDGYTWLLGSSGPMSIAPVVYKNAGYDPRKDFVPLMDVASNAQSLVVSSSSKFHSVADFVKAAKAAPGKLNYGSSGTGSTQHMTMELFKQRAGIDVLHTPYKGSAPAYTDLFGGQIDAMFDSLPPALSFMQAGRARILAVSTPQRDPKVPNIPTIAESGYPGFDVLGWLGLAAPKGLDPAIQAKIIADLKKVIAMDSVKTQFANQGLIPVGTAGADFGKYIDNEINKWIPVVKAGHIQID
ncbi:MAG TPA: tripartite tricarboxylate transporter substrate binding protein [Burkholderiales bacterium]|jgi:tripartite-type tricarboxylate transporter receptor subunit TctC